MREGERRYREVQTELAHANRVATMGQLAASIAHEVNQPIAATVTNAQAAKRWLNLPRPNLDEVGLALGRIVKDANRAADVLGRIRQLIRKAPPGKERVDINAAIREVVELTGGEARKSHARVETQLARDLPAIEGERVALQQVLLNLIVNAIEATLGVSEGRTAPADRHGLYGRWLRPRHRAGLRSGLWRHEPRQHLRALLYHQAHGPGHGVVHLPLDHRRARRPIVGQRERAARRRYPLHGARAVNRQAAATIIVRLPIPPHAGSGSRCAATTPSFVHRDPARNPCEPENRAGRARACWHQTLS